MSGVRGSRVTRVPLRIVLHVFVANILFWSQWDRLKTLGVSKFDVLLSAPFVCSRGVRCPLHSAALCPHGNQT